MLGYRYEIVDGNKKQGFLTALDDYFDTNKFFQLYWFFEDYLPEPKIQMNNTISFFTKKGNRKFHKAIVAIKKAYEKQGIQFICIQKEIKKEDILYQDDYQIICGSSSIG